MGEANVRPFHWTPCQPVAWRSVARADAPHPHAIHRLNIDYAGLTDIAFSYVFSKSQKRQADGRADKTTAAAAAIGDRASGHAVDARDAAKLQAFFATVGEIDHLIVALGGGSAIGAFKDLDEAKMRAGFDNKFWPYLNAIRHGVGHIRGSGSITLITGAAGRRANLRR